MKQSDLNRAVARLTGESVRLVRQRGFTLVHVSDDERDGEHNGAAQVPPQTNAGGACANLPSLPAA
jgi:hypothetical protein